MCKGTLVHDEQAFRGLCAALLPGVGGVPHQRVRHSGRTWQMSLTTS